MKNRIFITLFLMTVLSVFVPAFADTMYKSKAVASFYADKFHGRKTSSGEVFNMYAYTAAHKTLPFGTVVKVTNLDNGRSVNVRINDRGPFVSGREIDVSKAAAIDLDMISAGTANVSLEIVDADTGAGTGSSIPAWSAPVDSATIRWDIQLGAFSNKSNAESLANRLLKSGFENVAYQYTSNVTRVVLKDIATSNVQKYLDNLENRGYTDYFVRERPKIKNAASAGTSSTSSSSDAK